MSADAAKVIADALALSDEERAVVAEEILASLDSTEADTPEAAAAELIRGVANTAVPCST